MLEIGNIIEFTMPGSGCVNWSKGAKAEVVGKGRDNFVYIRLLGQTVLQEINNANNNKYKFWKKVEGSKIYK